MILEKLMEKKDVVVYLQMRIKQLRRNGREIKKIPERYRENAKRGLQSRIEELQMLKTIIMENRIREQGKIIWREERVMKEKKVRR
jgi:hypothetical protein